MSEEEWQAELVKRKKAEAEKKAKQKSDFWNKVKIRADQQVRFENRWYVSTSKSPIDDSTNVRLTRFTNEVKIGYKLVQPSLTIACTENRTSLHVNLNHYISTYDQQTVRYRLDKQAAKQVQWSPSTDYQALFAPRPIGLIKQMMLAGRFFIRIVPHGENPVDLEFNLKGLSGSIKPLYTACHWGPR